MNITEKAYAKINISLDVTGIRPDRYHEVKMIMQDLCLHDEIEISKSGEGGPVLLKLSGASPDVPCDGRNIAVKAALLMKEAYGIRENVSIRLKKHIPSAAGLAGGSADAAAVIRGMNRLFGLHLGSDEMEKLGVKIGADVPYCITGGTALSEGIGEKLTKLKTPEFFRGLHVLLVKPSAGVSTKEVYAALDDVLSFGKDIHPDVDGALSAMEREDFKGLCSLMGNILEKVTVRKLPEIGAIKEELLSAGAGASMMSGSGPTVFSFFSGPEECDAALRMIDSKYPGKYTLIKTGIRL